MRSASLPQVQPPGSNRAVWPRRERPQGPAHRPPTSADVSFRVDSAAQNPRWWQRAQLHPADGRPQPRDRHLPHEIRRSERPGLSRRSPGEPRRSRLFCTPTPGLGVDCGRGSVRSDCCPSRATGKDRCCGGPFRRALQNRALKKELAFPDHDRGGNPVCAGDAVVWAVRSSRGSGRAGPLRGGWRCRAWRLPRRGSCGLCRGSGPRVSRFHRRGRRLPRVPGRRLRGG